MKLTPDDFPIISIGSLVYRRTRSSAIADTFDPDLAADLVERLNRDAGAIAELGRSSPARPDPTPDTLAPWITREICAINPGRIDPHSAFVVARIILETLDRVRAAAQ